MFLAAWSLDPRSFADEAAATGRSAANRIRLSQFTRGNPRVSMEREEQLAVCPERENRGREKVVGAFRRHRHSRKSAVGLPSSFGFLSPAHKQPELAIYNFLCPCPGFTYHVLNFKLPTAPFDHILLPLGDISFFKRNKISKQYGAIDVGHIASPPVPPGGDERPDHACVLALLRSLQYNTFFTHLDLSTVNAAAPDCWGEDPLGECSDVSSGPLALALQV